MADNVHKFTVSTTPDVLQFTRWLKKQGKISPQMTALIQSSKEYKRWANSGKP